jgi:hypothetical protein
MTNIIDLTEKRKEKLLAKIDAVMWRSSFAPYFTYEDYQSLMSARAYVLMNHLPMADMLINEVVKRIEESKKQPVEVLINNRFFNIESQVEDDNE